MLIAVPTPAICGTPATIFVTDFEPSTVKYYLHAAEFNMVMTRRSIRLICIYDAYLRAENEDHPPCNIADCNQDY